MLLRIGIDKGTDGCLAPIFKDSSFEYIPLSETDIKSTENRTYRDIIGKNGKPLSFYLPDRVKDRKMHFDPEFNTFTYGDQGSKRNYLLKLEKSDLLVFYAGLTPFNHEILDEALYIIGYFTVENVIDFNKLRKDEIEKYCKIYFNNAHIKRNFFFDNFVIVTGDKDKSKLIDKAILISEKKLNRIGRQYHIVSRKMEKLLGIRGSIQRSIPPRFIENKKNLDNLLKLLNYP
ncbi:hypothetical protein [Methanobacterium oryzae]|uniref:Nmad3 family putative nucleotide modification protein n=1 Tax=Methanobacterium oryzae TaxID=69540 RepID=UPI003D1E655A